MLELLTKDTIPEALNLIYKFHLESLYKERKFSGDKVQRLLEDTVLDTEYSLGLLYRKEDKIIGVLCATTAEFIFSPELFTSELCYYVLPEYRKTRAGFELMKAYEYWSENVVKAQGCTLVNLDDERIHKMYLKKGFEPTERSYLKWQQ